MRTLGDLSIAAGEHERSKGFRQDWQDSEWLEGLADTYELDLTTTQREELRRIASTHRTMLLCTKLMLVCTEAAEAVSELRDVTADGIEDSKFTEELADVVIRVMGLADMVDGDIEYEVVTKMEKNAARPYRHGRKY